MSNYTMVDIQYITLNNLELNLDSQVVGSEHTEQSLLRDSRGAMVQNYEYCTYSKESEKTFVKERHESELSKYEEGLLTYSCICA